jgi:hypothetical protein
LRGGNCMRFDKYFAIAIATLFYCLLPDFIYAQAGAPAAESKNEAATPAAKDDNQLMGAALNKQMVKFFTDSPNCVLRSKNKGIQLFDLETKAVLSDGLLELGITAMAVDPSDVNLAFVATSDGKIWKVSAKNQKLRAEELKSFTKQTGGAISQIIFKMANVKSILVSDSQSIYLSKDGGAAWDLKNPIRIEKEGSKFMRLLIQDPFFKDKFLVEMQDGSRFQGDWNTGKIVLKEEKAIPHGYGVTKDGFYFTPLGENAEIFSFVNFEIRISDFVINPSVPNQFFIAGLGRSPLKIDLADNRYAITYLNLRLFMTTSIDVSKTNPLNIVIGTPNGISFSKDGGQNWLEVE